MIANHQSVINNQKSVINDQQSFIFHLLKAILALSK